MDEGLAGKIQEATKACEALLRALHGDEPPVIARRGTVTTVDSDQLAAAIYSIGRSVGVMMNGFNREPPSSAIELARSELAFVAGIVERWKLELANLKPMTQR